MCSRLAACSNPSSRGEADSLDLQPGRNTSGVTTCQRNCSEAKKHIRPMEKACRQCGGSNLRMPLATRSLLRSTYLRIDRASTTVLV